MCWALVEVLVTLQRTQQCLWEGDTLICDTAGCRDNPSINRYAASWHHVKGKGEKERYTHLHAEFQRTARRDKKAFLSEQCGGIEKNNRMEMTGDHFKKIRDTKGTFHAKMSSIKDRNDMDLTEADDIKKRW